LERERDAKRKAKQQQEARHLERERQEKEKLDNERMEREKREKAADRGMRVSQGIRATRGPMGGRAGEFITELDIFY
jgi:hypothetical protein